MGRTISAYGMGRLHVLKGTMNAERYIKILEQHMLPSRCLFQGRPFVFQHDNAKSHTAAVFYSRVAFSEKWGWGWIGLSADLSPIENIWCIIKKNMPKMTTNSSAAGNLYQARLRSNSKQKLQKLKTSMPRHLHTVLKIRVDATQW